MSEKRLELVRGLGAWASAAIVVGTMIGTGIFLKPAEMAREGHTVSVVCRVDCRRRSLPLRCAVLRGIGSDDPGGRRRVRVSAARLWAGVGFSVWLDALDRRPALFDGFHFRGDDAFPEFSAASGGRAALHCARHHSRADR